jgi:hypothetical protein
LQSREILAVRAAHCQCHERRHPADEHGRVDPAEWFRDLGVHIDDEEFFVTVPLVG